MSAPEDLAIDIARVDWFDAFFSRVHGMSAGEILDAIESLEVEVEQLEETGDLAELAMSGWAYWTLYIKGYVDYSSIQQVTPDNIYLRYLVGYFGPRGHDPGLQETLIDADAAVPRVALRYRDFDAFRNHHAAKHARLAVDPAVLTIIDPPPDHAKVVYEAETGRALQPVVVDGYHRIFLARLFGVPAFRAQVMFSSDFHPPL